MAFKRYRKNYSNAVRYIKKKGVAVSTYVKQKKNAKTWMIVAGVLVAGIAVGVATKKINFNFKQG
jgi:hypothetical protein